MGIHETAPKIKKILPLHEIEAMEEADLKQIRLKEQAFNDFVGYWRARLPLMGEEIEGSNPDIIEQAQEAAANFQNQDQAAAAISKASEEMVRLTALASSFLAKAS